MTLFTLLIVMALERVTAKNKAFHITTLAQKYFSFVKPIINKQRTDNKDKHNSDILIMLLVAALPTIVAWLLIDSLPSVLVFFLYLAVLWVCLGCPVTRQTYKRYLQAANREDFEACSLYSEKLGNQGGDLSNFGKQLVLVNYRQYASIIIFFVILGLPGVIFYSICKEWYLMHKNNAQTSAAVDEASIDDTNNITQQSVEQSDELSEEKVMFFLDWLPSRITAFGFLLVGDFSKGLSVWVNTILNPELSTYDVLAKVAKSSEELTSSENPQLEEPLQMVRLVKRNIIFLLMVISVMTLSGLIG